MGIVCSDEGKTGAGVGGVLARVLTLGLDSGDVAVVATCKGLVGRLGVYIAGMGDRVEERGNCPEAEEQLVAAMDLAVDLVSPDTPAAAR